MFESRLSRRERQLLDVLYRLGKATAEEIRSELPDPPLNATVRRLLRILEEKGHISHNLRGQVFVYEPSLRRETAGRSALRHLVSTFFAGSTSKAVTAMLSMSGHELSAEELDELSELIAEYERQEESND